jgi:hypothetical protein
VIDADPVPKGFLSASSTPTRVVDIDPGRAEVPGHRYHTLQAAIDWMRTQTVYSDPEHHVYSEDVQAYVFRLAAGTHVATGTELYGVGGNVTSLHIVGPSAGEPTWGHALSGGNGATLVSEGDLFLVKADPGLSLHLRNLGVRFFSDGVQADPWYAFKFDPGVYIIDYTQENVTWEASTGTVKLLLWEHDTVDNVGAGFFGLRSRRCSYVNLYGGQSLPAKASSYGYDWEGDDFTLSPDVTFDLHNFVTSSPRGHVFRGCRFPQKAGFFDLNNALGIGVSLGDRKSVV